ncbi:DUF4279 domain-containing protein [Nonomuraea cavernae]|uniref:DUF4279 domain-containing protein n=1 Tax=Nonomuraea cavernae TaxID=2045107 RepID=UPI0034115F7B
MRVRQYAYFAVRSEYMDATEIAVRIGVKPDEITVRGSKSTEPPRPATHTWQIMCREPGLTVDEMIAQLVDRLAPFSQAVGRLVDELNQRCPDDRPCAVLQVVRYLDGEDGEDEDLTSSHPGLEKMAGQHQLLGWRLDRRVLRFLVTTGAELDVDEYG